MRKPAPRVQGLGITREKGRRKYPSVEVGGDEGEQRFVAIVGPPPAVIAKGQECEGGVGRMGAVDVAGTGVGGWG